MIRLKGFSAALGLALLLTGCGAQTKAPVAQPASSPAAMEPAVAEPSAAQEQAQAQGNIPMETYSVELLPLADADGVEIYYPVLSGLGDEAAQAALNERFLVEAQLAADDLPDGAECSFVWTVQTQSETLLSLRRDGYFFAPGAAHPTASCITRNIDPASGETLTLAGLCDTAALAKTLMQESYIVTGPSGEDVSEAVTLGELIEQNSWVLEEQGGPVNEAMLKALLDTVDCETDGGVSGYSYWENGRLHLVFSYYHAVGDYVDVLPQM